MPLINIIVNSRDKEFFSNIPSAFTYKISNFVNKPKRFYVDSVQMYNSQYTINSFNRVLNWTDTNGNAKTSTLTMGFYNATDLATHIQTVMNTDNTTGTGTFTVSFSRLTGKYTLINSVGNWGLPFNSRRTTNNATAIMLGFGLRDLTGASTYTSDFMISLSSKFFLVRLNLFSKNTYTRKGVNSMAVYVPNDVSYGDMINYKPQFNRWIDIDYLPDLQQMKFEVRDDKNNLAELNADWTMNLVIETE
jgi:hypothetical protein